MEEVKIIDEGNKLPFDVNEEDLDGIYVRK